MKIELSMIPTLWYENKDGERWIPDYNADGPPDTNLPPGFIYQHSQFPTNLRESILYIVQKDEVEACEHSSENVQPTGGWIDGVEGRECKKCYGSQTKNVDDPWPEEWDAYGSRSVMSGNSGWSEDLALALVTAQSRPEGHPHLSLGDAILVAAIACERCMNTLANQYGLDWGYEYMSDDWKKCGTSCQFCKGDGFERVPLKPGDKNYPELSGPSVEGSSPPGGA